MTGTFPEHLTNSLAATPQPWTAATPSRMSAPDDSTKQTIGIPCSWAIFAAAARFSPSIGFIDLVSPAPISTCITLRPAKEITFEVTEPVVLPRILTECFDSVSMFRCRPQCLVG